MRFPEGFDVESRKIVLQPDSFRRVAVPDSQSRTGLRNHPVFNIVCVKRAPPPLKSAVQILRGKQIEMAATDILVDGNLAIVAAAWMFSLT